MVSRTRTTTMTRRMANIDITLYIHQQSYTAAIVPRLTSAVGNMGLYGLSLTCVFVLFTCACNTRHSSNHSQLHHTTASTAILLLIHCAHENTAHHSSHTQQVHVQQHKHTKQHHSQHTNTRTANKSINKHRDVTRTARGRREDWRGKRERGQTKKGRVWDRRDEGGWRHLSACEWKDGRTSGRMRRTCDCAQQQPFFLGSSGLSRSRLLSSAGPAPPAAACLGSFIAMCWNMFCTFSPVLADIS